MAGNKNHLLHHHHHHQQALNHLHLHHAHHNRSYLKRLNALNLMGVSNGSYYSSNTISPKLTTLTMSSSNSLLRKRIHSSSPSKGSSYPYHTMATCLPSDTCGLLFSAGGSNRAGVSPTSWDTAFKRLKVVHSPPSSSMLASTSKMSSTPASSSTTVASKAASGGDNDDSPATCSNSSAEQLNELAQDLNRLKTPFT